MQPLVPLVLPSLYPPSFRRNDFLYLYTVALSASCVYQAVRRERDREGDSSLYTVALSASCVYQAVRERER